MRYLLLCCSILLLFSSCRKFNEVANPDFDVTVEKNTYSAGEPITFNFKGSANIITFYSGEPGSEYEFKDRIKVDGGTPQMEFTSRQQYGPQDTTLKLMISSDFKNVFDLESLQAATWTDITNRAVLSPGGGTDTASGIIDLSDVTQPDSLVYIAFKYTGKKDTVSQPTWTIKNVLIQNKLPDGSVIPIAKSSDISWGVMNVLNTSRGWSFNTSQIQMSGGPIGTDDNEDWIISEPLTMNRVQRSLGVSVKSNPTALQTNYVFSGYPEPGTYKAIFEVTNANRWDKKMVVKEILITVQ